MGLDRRRICGHDGQSVCGGILFILRYLEGYHFAEWEKIFWLLTGTVRSRLTGQYMLCDKMFSGAGGTDLTDDGYVW